MFAAQQMCVGEHDELFEVSAPVDAHSDAPAGGVGDVDGDDFDTVPAPSGLCHVESGACPVAGVEFVVPFVPGFDGAVEVFVVPRRLVCARLCFELRAPSQFCRVELPDADVVVSAVFGSTADPSDCCVRRRT